MKPLARILWRFLSGLFGLLCLVVFLALLASVPILNFLAFGYLLEAAGRTARSGRWRDGVFGVRQARIAGSVAIAAWFGVLPIRFLSGLRTDATLLGDPSAPSLELTGSLLRWMGLGLALATLFGLLLAGDRHAQTGTGPRHSPFFPRARDGILAFIADLHLPKLFWLGLRGWVGGLGWLAPPIAVLFAASRIPNNAAILVAGAGILLMTPVAVALPLVQARFATTRRWADLFDWASQRRLFRNAPWACFVAVLTTLAAALPLYLLRIELPPRDLAWLPGLLFIALLWPAKILAGWAIHRSEYHPNAGPRGALWSFLPRLLLLGTGLAYGVGIWITQYLDWDGTASFLEPHAFLLPAPVR